MSDRGPVRLPLVCCVLIDAASWLVPRALRPQWRKKWRDDAGHWWAFLHERDEFLIRDGFRYLLLHCSTAFADAFWLRFPREGVRRFVRGPAFVLVAALAALGVIAAASGGLRTLRSVRSPLPYGDSQQLVTISQEAMFGYYGNPRRQVLRWGETSKKLSAVGAWLEWPERRGFATSNLFALLGVRPVLGRTFRSDDRDVVLLSYEHWRREHRADPRVIGLGVMVGKSEMRVIGVLPPAGAMPGLPEPPVWTMLDLNGEQPRRLVDTVGRLRPGITLEAAQKELARLAAAERKKIVSDVRVMPFRVPVQIRAFFYMATPAIGAVLGVILAAIGRQSPVAGHISWRRRLRCWAFLVLKTVLVLFALTAFWIEAATPSRVIQSDTEVRRVVDLLAAIIPGWSFVVACALAVLWCVVDQRRRCPVCLHRLALPVTIGSWSRPLLDPVTTEFVCEQGHGALAVPETLSSTAEPDRWTAMDESWRDLFIGK